MVHFFSFNSIPNLPHSEQEALNQDPEREQTELHSIQKLLQLKFSDTDDDDGDEDDDGDDGVDDGDDGDDGVDDGVDGDGENKQSCTQFRNSSSSRRR